MSALRNHEVRVNNNSFVNDMKKHSAEKLPIANIAIVVRAVLCLERLAGQLGKLNEFTKIWRNLGK